MRLNADQAKMLSQISRQYPEFTEFLESWRQAEMEMLVACGSNATGILQGRSQVLGELKKSLTGPVKTP